MAVILDLADAVATRLNAASFTESFTATRDVLPIKALEDIAALEVSVAAGAEAWEKSDRAGSYTVTYDVIVAVQAPIGTETAVDACLVTVEEVKADLASQRMAGLPLVEVEQEQPFDAELLYSSNVFLAVITFRYRGFK